MWISMFLRSYSFPVSNYSKVTLFHIDNNYNSGNLYCAIIHKVVP